MLKMHKHAIHCTMPRTETDGQIDLWWAEMQWKTYTLTYKNSMRTPAVKCKIMNENKANIKQTDRKTNKKQSGKYTIVLNGIKYNLHVMLDFQHTSIKCRIAFFLYVLDLSFSFQQSLTDLTLTNTLSEWMNESSIYVHIHHVYYHFCNDLLLMHWERKHNKSTILGVFKWKIFEIQDVCVLV